MNNDINSKNEKDTKEMEKTQAKVVKKIEETLDEKKSIDTGKKFNENPLDWFTGKLVIISSAIIVVIVTQIVFSDSKTKALALVVTLSCLSVLTFFARKVKKKQKEWQETNKKFQSEIGNEETEIANYIKDFKKGNYYFVNMQSKSGSITVTQVKGTWKLVYVNHITGSKLQLKSK
jgi:hypothetical protein